LAYWVLPTYTHGEATARIVRVTRGRRSKGPNSNLDETSSPEKLTIGLYQLLMFELRAKFSICSQSKEAS
jgi:hypothetical protein